MTPLHRAGSNPVAAITGDAFTVTTTGAVAIHPKLFDDKIYVPAPTAVASPTTVVPSDSK